MNAEADTSFGQRQYDRQWDQQQNQWNQQQMRQTEQTIELIVASFRPTLQLQASALRACADGLSALAQHLEMVERNFQRQNTPQQSQQRNIG